MTQIPPDQQARQSAAQTSGAMIDKKIVLGLGRLSASGQGVL